VKVSLLNFMITVDGLTDQLLDMVVTKEKPALQEEKNLLILQGAENKRQMQEAEDKILEVLSSSQGNLLDDSTAVDVLSEMKVFADDVSAKQEVAEVTEKRIDEARLGYKPFATHAALLYFTVTSMANIDPMYQFSLSWYVGHFQNSMTNAAPSMQVPVRLNNMKETFLQILYNNVCRSLFEKDKLLFALLLTITLNRAKGTVDPAEWRFFLTGLAAGAPDGELPSNPASDWLPTRAWEELNSLSRLKVFQGLIEDVVEYEDDWRAVYDSSEPGQMPLTEKFELLNRFQRLMVLRALRPDKVVTGVTYFVTNEIGELYTMPPPFDLGGTFADSTPITPIVFVLSAGTDPTRELLSFADSRRQAVKTISLGQGQGPKAEQVISLSRGDGTWVVLQNCHLAASWMGRLEQLCETFTLETCEPLFRLWLTSYPSEHFPISILQNSVKTTNEPPKGLRTNLLRLYNSEPISDKTFFNGCDHPAWLKLLYGLCFFHAVAQERLKFGPLGFNVPYQFSDADFIISARQLQMFLRESRKDRVPFKALEYTTGECNYGGRVTDDHDRTCLMSLLQKIYSPDLLERNYRFSPSGSYMVPSDLDIRGYWDFIQRLPAAAAPEVFGLHENADITKDIQETNLLCSTVLLTQEREGGGDGGGQDTIVEAIAKSLLDKLPENFDLEKVQAKWPVLYEESMNTVLHQELIRFNRLITVVRESLQNLLKALKGFVLMSTDLEALSNDMFNGKMPGLWAKRSYGSLKPLNGYFKDLLQRLTMLQEWVDNGKPNVFWLSGFYFTHAFLTGALQNYARKHQVPIDDIVFDFEMLAPKPIQEWTPPEDGVYTHGLFLEGARWENATSTLSESLPKVLFSAAPAMWLKPLKREDLAPPPHYNCPVYRTADRRGTLSTTGHSTNFVLDIRVPSDMPKSHWINRGVAMLCSLSDG